MAIGRPKHVLAVGVVPDLSELQGFGRLTFDITVMCRESLVHKLGTSSEGQYELIAMPNRSDQSEWVATAKRLHERSQFDAIVSIHDSDQPFAPPVARALGLPWHSEEVVELALNKTAMRARLAGAGLDDTPHRPVESIADLLNFLKEQAAPVVLKPAKGTGGLAHPVSTPDDAARAWDYVSSTRDSFAGPMVAERRLVGPMLSVDAFTEDGQHAVVGCTRRFTHPTRFVGLGHVCPSGLGRQVEQEVAGYVTKVLDALEVPFGPTHTEVIVTDQGPRVLENHVRPAGGFILKGLSEVTGVDLRVYAVWQALGASGLVTGGALPVLTRPASPASAAWHIAATCEGVVREVRGAEKLATRPQVVEALVAVKPGDRVREPRMLEERLGHVRCHGETPGAALAACRSAAASVEVLVSALRDPYAPAI